MSDWKSGGGLMVIDIPPGATPGWYVNQARYETMDEALKAAKPGETVIRLPDWHENFDEPNTPNPT